MSLPEWAEFDLDLPSGASIELFATEVEGLRLEIDVHADEVTLLQLADTLRRAVVAVEERRRLLAS